MRRVLHLATGMYTLAAVAMTGCDDAQTVSASPGVTPPAANAKPWERISPDSLYGATTVEVELDLLGIPPGWDGMRIAAISDLQIGLWDQNGEVAAAAIRRAVELKPDLIVLLGDYLARGADTTELARALLPLRGRRVLAVLGDRDVRTDTLEAAVTRTLSSQGIRVLKNGSVPIVHNGDTAAVSGVDPDLAEQQAGDQIWALSQLGTGRLGLLLAHNPLLASRAPNGRFPGALAGGTFCGRVEVPGTPRVSWLNSEGIPGSAVTGAPRLYKLSNYVMFVTCGTGYGFIPVRFGAPPEVALVTLRHPGRRAVEEPGAPDSLDLDSLIQRYQRRDTSAADTGG